MWEGILLGMGRKRLARAALPPPLLEHQRGSFLFRPSMKGQLTAMETKIDYVAFTVGTHPLPKELTDDVQDYVLTPFANCGIASAWADLAKLTWEVVPARGFYRWCAREK